MLCRACSLCAAAYLGNKPGIHKYEAGLYFDERRKVFFPEFMWCKL